MTPILKMNKKSVMVLAGVLGLLAVGGVGGAIYYRADLIARFKKIAAGRRLGDIFIDEPDVRRLGDIDIDDDDRDVRRLGVAGPRPVYTCNRGTCAGRR